jgi:hypothetical protein
MGMGIITIFWVLPVAVYEFGGIVWKNCHFLAELSVIYRNSGKNGTGLAPVENELF